MSLFAIALIERVIDAFSKMRRIRRKGRDAQAMVVIALSAIMSPLDSLWLLKQHYPGKLRITDVREMFVQMKIEA